MKISVVIASFNGGMFLQEQLASIAMQSVPPHEIIVSDDQSTDSTPSIVSTFAAQNPHISVIFSVNPSPLGADKNFEHAISQSTGNIIFICDQDDVWLPDRIEIMLQAFNSHSPSATFCDSRIVDQNLNDLGYSHLQSRGFQSYQDIFDGNCLDFLKRVPPAGHDMAFDSSFKEVLLPFPNLKNCYDTWIGLTLFALGAWKPSSPIPLTLFRRHSNSLTRSGLSPSLKDLFAQAKKAVDDDTSAWYAALYQQLIERVKNRVSPNTLSLLEARLAHSIARSQMNVSFPKRFKLVIQETLNKNYFRFGRSYLNIIQDLFFRKPR